jgi:putative membrane protein
MGQSMTTLQSKPNLELAILKSVGNGRALVAILLLSASVFGFLFWLVYVKPAAGYTSHVIGALPAVNASLNSLSTVFLIGGYIAIRRRQYRRHFRLMLSALASSALFFVCYVIYHNAHGDTKFLSHGPVRPAYFTVLISHIVLSGISVPLILLSFYLSLSGHLALHKRVSRFTFPIWLYVSVTGVVVFAMLKIFNS